MSQPIDYKKNDKNLNVGNDVEVSNLLTENNTQSTIDKVSYSINTINLGEKNNKFQRKLLILYGGETGNCEDLAKRIGWQALNRKFELCSLKFDDYKIGKLVKEEFVLFICSTTNQGDEPLTMRNFWNFLMKKSLPLNSLSDIKCAVIGLGDSSYLKYNFVGKKLFKRLKQLGANLLLEICLGDDQHDLGFYGAVDPWLLKFWSKIEKFFPDVDNKNFDDFYFQNLYSVDLVTNEFNQFKEIKNVKSVYQKDVYNCKNYFKSEVISNEKLTDDNHFQDTRLIKIKIDDQNNSLLYKPGDIVMVLPQNTDDCVNEFISLFNLERKQKVIINKLDENFLCSNLYNTIYNQPITIVEIVKNYFDITYVPKRSFFQVLFFYSKDSVEKEKLKEFASTSGQKDLYEYCTKSKRNILEIFIDFPKTSNELKIEHLFQLIPSIFPRPYSISSALNECPRELHILNCVKIQKTMLKKLRLGLCSNYLKSVKANDKVQIYIRKGTFKLPNDKIPLIMIGPGTGVAPFRSIIQDRVCKGIACNFLFFGCRYKDKDFYFEKEWAEYNARGFLYYFVAFSREQTNKVYVQDKLWKEKNLVWELISKCDAHILVSGTSTLMPKQVRETLIKILQLFGGDDLKGEKAEIVIEKFEARKKLQFECWD